MLNDILKMLDDNIYPDDKYKSKGDKEDLFNTLLLGLKRFNLNEYEYRVCICLIEDKLNEMN